MKITDIKTSLYTFTPLDVEISWRQPGKSKNRNSAIVQVYTDEGIVGIGEASDCYGHHLPKTIKVLIEEGLKPILLDEDPTNIEKLLKKMYDRAFVTGFQGLFTEAISGVEIALWDILGKIEGKPLYKILGGYSDKVRVYASTHIGLLSIPQQEQAKEALKLVEEGWSAIKLRGGRNPDWDENTVKVVQDTIGDEVDLILDVFMSYNLNTAIKLAKRLEKYNLFFLEEPLPPYDIDGLATLTAKVNIPIAAGEHVYTKYGFKELITKKAVDILQPDCTITGGLLECKKIFAMADAWNLLCIPHCFASAVGLMATLHLAASVSNCPIVEYDVTKFNPLRDELLTESDTIRVKRGYVELSRKPGLGIELNEKNMEKYAL